MKALVFDTHSFERPVFEELNSRFGHELHFTNLRLSEATAGLAKGYTAVVIFTHDLADAAALARLRQEGVRFLALRSAGFNHVDLPAAKAAGLRVARVPAYSPYAVAEHAVALILALNRKLVRAAARVRELNFSLDGLVGFDLHGKTVGLIGAGKIGSVLARIMRGFGCRVLVQDLSVKEELIALGCEYVSREELLGRSDIISLHLPLSPDSHHCIDGNAIGKMKRGVMLINTGRGGLIDAKALIAALKTGQVGAAGLDVYEEEENVFFQDLSSSVLQDDILARLMTFPNVLITAHQGFLTKEALHNIAETTLANLTAFERGEANPHELNP